MRDLFARLLVSSPNGGGLFLVDKGVPRKLDGFDTTGISLTARLFLRGLQKQPSSLWIFHEQNTIELRGDLAVFNDVHDVLCSGEYIYIVSTANNEIIKLDRIGTVLRRWIFAGQNDAKHINCLANWHGRVIFSAFGDFQEARGWNGKTSGAGYVQDLASGERLIVDLSQPHSLVPAGQNLLVANSEEKELREYSPSGTLCRSKRLDGYTRGIWVTAKIIYVGLSRSRNIEDRGLTTATIVSLDRKSWEELGRISLPTNEVYSILQVANAPQLIEILAQVAAQASSTYVNLPSELKESQSKLTAVLQSNSWRITLPLREARRWVDAPTAQAKHYAQAALRGLKRMYQALRHAAGRRS